MGSQTWVIWLQGAVAGAIITFGLLRHPWSVVEHSQARRLAANLEARGGCEPSASAPPAAWWTEDGRLQSTLHLANVDASGALLVPPTAKLVLEIGANSRNTADLEYLPLEDEAFLVSFEPLLDKWATLLSRNSKPDRIGVLGHHHPRGIALPFAVSSTRNGQVTLKVSGSIDGCASLLTPKVGYFSKACTNHSGILESRTVPSVSLDVAIDRWLGGRMVEFVKIDAQGLDLEVLRSAGAALQRIRAVQLEVVRDRKPLPCKVQYEGAAESKCPATVAALAALGFEPWGTNCSVHTFQDAHGCEADMTFVRPGDFDEKFVRALCTARWPHSCGPGAWSSQRFTGLQKRKPAGPQQLHRG
jgi:FkbM family methyltransferase